MNQGHPDLEGTYRAYDGSARVMRRRSVENPGNTALHEERNSAIEAILASHAAHSSLRVFADLGCGDGSFLEELQLMPPLQDATVLGFDVLGFRLKSGRDRTALLPLVNADGSRLPMRSGSADAVILATVLSSIRSTSLAEQILSEVDRVLRPGGLVVWYDMRVPNPANRALCPVRRRRLKALVPGYEVDLQSITVVPQLARRLGRMTALLYPVLARMPWLHTHLVGALRKPCEDSLPNYGERK